MDTACTTGCLARKINRPIWMIQRAADAIPDEVPRIGSYRVLSPELQSKIIDWMTNRGWMKSEVSSC